MRSSERWDDESALIFPDLETAVSVSGLTAQHQGADEPAIVDVSLDVPRGARVALIGANGAGKSTLLKALLGLVQIRAGTVQLFGGTFAAQRKRVAYLPQTGELDWRFPISVRRLVLTGRYVHLGWIRRPGVHDYAEADSALSRLGLTDLAERQIGQLSGGQRQRALLARALVQGADLLLLDEPFAAMDAASRDVLREVLDQLRAEGATVLLATHELESLDLDPDAMVMLRDGRLVEGQGLHDFALA